MEIGILILVLLALAGRGDTSEPETPAETPPEPPGGPWPSDRVVPVGELEGIAQALGLSPDWGTFFAVVAEGESRRHVAALNEGDASAARKAYQRNRERYENCPWGEDAYTMGAYGLYQLLPANGMAAWWGTAFQCLDPRIALTDPVLATIAAVQYARRVMLWDDWQRSPKTWMALRRAWAAPTYADESRPATERRMREAMARIGVPESFAGEPVDPLPPWDVETLTAMRLAELGIG